MFKKFVLYARGSFVFCMAEAFVLYGGPGGSILYGGGSVLYGGGSGRPGIPSLTFAHFAFRAFADRFIRRLPGTRQSCILLLPDPCTHNI